MNDFKAAKIDTYFAIKDKEQRLRKFDPTHPSLIPRKKKEPSPPAELSSPRKISMMNKNGLNSSMLNSSIVKMNSSKKSTAKNKKNMIKDNDLLEPEHVPY